MLLREAQRVLLRRRKRVSVKNDTALPILIHININKSFLALPLLLTGYRHLEKHRITAVLETDVLAARFKISLLPYRYFARHCFFVGLGLVTKTLLKHVVF